MFKFLDLKYGAFGLDINDSSLKIIKLGKKQSGFCMESFGELKLKAGVIVNGAVKDENYLTEAIKSACATVKGQKLKTKYAVCSLPEEGSFLQVIQMPKMDEVELGSAISFEAENYIPLPIDQVYLDFQIITPLQNVTDHYDILVVAIDKKSADAYLSCIKKANLVPLVLEVEFQSVARSLIKNGISEQPVVILDIGENNTDFIIFSGCSVRFTYSIPIASSQLTNSISKFLGVSFKEAEHLKLKYGLDGMKGEKSEAVLRGLWPLLDEFVSRIKEHIDFYQEHVSHEHLLAKSRVKKIIMCGGGANLKGLPYFLSQKLGIAAEIGDPFVNIGAKPIRGDIDKMDFQSSAACLGLAQRAAGEINYKSY